MSGTVYWITGLAGAGKTTIGRALYEKIKREKDNIVLLDGDELRNAIADDLGYTLEDRYRSATRNSKLCRLLADQDIDVICCTISMFEDIRRWNRDNNKKYFEIYIKVSMDILQRRNQKKLYTDNQQEVVGLGVGMEEPQNPDLIVYNDGNNAPNVIVDDIIRKYEEKSF